MNPLSRAQLGI